MKFLLRRASYGMASVIKDGYVEDTAIMKSFMASIFMVSVCNQTELKTHLYALYWFRSVLSSQQ